MKPPVAPVRPHERVRHGDVVQDPYYWLIDREDPETLAYLREENAYADESTADQAELREEIFQEIKRRTQETDLSVPSREGDWWYYSRTEEGRQYAVHCRVAADGDDPPALSEDGSALPGEQVLLDGNVLAEGHDFLSLGVFEVSPDGGLLAYSVDFAGNERFTLKVRDLATGQDLPDEVPNTAYSAAWSADATQLFYSTTNDAWRSDRILRHTLGTEASEDVLIVEEPDERFAVGIHLTRSQRYLVLTFGSNVTSEVRLLASDDPLGDFRVVFPRRQGVECRVDHWAHPTDPAQDRLLILHSGDGKVNFELATASLDAPEELSVLIPHDEATRLDAAQAFADRVVVYYRRDGLTHLASHPVTDGVISAQGVEFEMPEHIHTVRPGANPSFRAARYRFSYVSMVTPPSVYEFDPASGEMFLLKQTPVLGGYDPADYVQQRIWATAPDGVRVPMTMVHRKGVTAQSPNPCLLYGYGSYEYSVDPGFSIARLSLLDRGFVYVIAHIRGGGELGRRWYEDGKLLAKRNTFTDFVACARHLIDQGWTAPDRLVARGGSAGGLLMGAVANLDPAAFCGIVADVPFVDAVNTILDPSLPLTVTEWEEWGNPIESAEVYQYMKSYTPYENVAAVDYPAILAVTSLNDTRVGYHEPAKWIARLRATATGGRFLLKTEMEAGHGGRSGRYDSWHQEAFRLAWVIAVATEA
ncbi:S9 family peptidase [Catenulispora subtropica]|uniref:S9 family peptidase n=1 Tax=Catenulispora subtropica TaxID=450798 RepID=A0ABP5EHZ3_9ACTN